MGKFGAKRGGETAGSSGSGGVRDGPRVVLRRLCGLFWGLCRKKSAGIGCTPSTGTPSQWFEVKTRVVAGTTAVQTRRLAPPSAQHTHPHGKLWRGAGRRNCTTTAAKRWRRVLYGDWELYGGEQPPVKRVEAMQRTMAAVG